MLFGIGTLAVMGLLGAVFSFGISVPEEDDDAFDDQTDGPDPGGPGDAQPLATFATHFESL